MKRLAALFGIAVVLALFAVACGGGEKKETSAQGGVTVGAELKEMSIKLDKSSVAAGKVTFQGKNTGTIPHELVVLKTDLAPNALKVSGGEADEKAAGQVIGHIEPDELGPGKSASATFDLTLGKYVLLCNVAGHYQAGMTVAFEVK